MQSHLLVFTTLLCQVLLLVNANSASSADVSSNEVSDDDGLDRRIFGGTAQTYRYNSFVYVVKLMVQLRTRVPTSRPITERWNCTGTALSDRVIISTRDCLVRNGKTATKVKMIIGYYQNSYDEAYSNQIHVFPCNPDQQNCSTHNIALIHIPLTSKSLSSSIYSGYGSGIFPALPLNDSTWNDFRELMQAAVIAGWGDTPSQTSYVVSAEVNKIANSVCQDYYDVDVTPEYSCIRMKRIGTCVGDEGGPLIVIRGTYQGNYFNGRSTLVGISVSHPDTCGDEDTPSIYLNIFPYINWIKQYIA